MDVQWLLLFHVLLTLILAVSVICGHWPLFRGTFIQTIQNFITYGAFDYFLRFVGVVFGSKGANVIASVEYYCCHKPNPLFQVFYVSITLGIYYMIVKSCFNYIPGYYIGRVHRYTSFLSVGVGLFLFILTSFSDPGVVNVGNADHYLSCYPYDNVIYSEKECSTCKIPKPARSKHCSICDRCVARFDHHCAWMNNCIGERNIRYFLVFIFWHFLLCIYGVVAVALVLAGQLKEINLVYILTVYYGVEKSVSGLAPHMIQWLLGSSNTQVLIMVFLAIIAALLAGFFGYHFKLSLSNTTTNEAFKWEEYNELQRKVREVKDASASLKSNENDEIKDGRGKKEKKWWKLCWRGPKNEDDEEKAHNIYDKGYMINLLEIIFPFSTRLEFSNTKSKCG